MTTIRVRPRTGIILPGIPREGADVEADLAREWIDNGLVVRVEDRKPPTAKRAGTREGR